MGTTGAYKPLEHGSSEGSLLERNRNKMIVAVLMAMFLVFVVAIILSVLIGFLVGYDLRSVSSSSASSSSVAAGTTGDFSSSWVSEDFDHPPYDIPPRVPQKIIYGTWRMDKQRTNQFYSSTNGKLSWDSVTPLHSGVIPIPTRQDIVIIPDFNITPKLSAVHLLSGNLVNELIFDDVPYFEFDSVFTFAGNSEEEDHGIAITYRTVKTPAQLISFKVTRESGLELTSALKDLPMSYNDIWLDDTGTGLLALGSNSLTFIDLATLDVMWTVSPTPTSSNRNVITLSDKIVIGGRVEDEHHVLAYDYSGTLLWRTESIGEPDVFTYDHSNLNDAFYFSIGAASREENKVFVVTDEFECDDDDIGVYQRQLNCIDSLTGKIDWSVDLELPEGCATNYQSSVYLLWEPREYPNLPYLIIVWSYDTLYGYSPDGERKWTANGTYISAIMKDGRILLINGDVYSAAGETLPNKNSVAYVNQIQPDAFVDHNMNAFYPVNSAGVHFG